MCVQIHTINIPICILQGVIIAVLKGFFYLDGKHITLRGDIQGKCKQV